MSETNLHGKLAVVTGDYLGHFALATRILPLLSAGRARVTTQDGPRGLLHLTGRAAEEKVYRSARDPQDAARLWDLSLELARVSIAVEGH